MTSIVPNVSVKTFFDRPAVMRRFDAGKLRYLRRAGGKVRLTARRLIRDRQGVSEAGDPPSSHTRVLKEGIFFGLDADGESTAIGPVRRTDKQLDDNVPNLLEFGGDAVRQFFIDEGVEGRRDRKGRFLKGRKRRIVHSRQAPRRRVHYRPRPYMFTAMARIAPELPQLYADSVDA